MKKKMSHSFFKSLMLCLSIGNSIQALAETPPVLGVVPQMSSGSGSEPLRILSGNNPYLNCPNGTCSLSFPTVVDQGLLEKLSEVSTITRDKYTQLIQNSKSDLNKLLKLAINDEQSLFRLSQKSALSNTMIPAEDLYKAYSLFVQQLEMLKNDFEMNASFFNGDLPGIPLKDKDYIANTLPTIAAGPIKGITNGYKSRLQSIVNSVCELPFSITLPRTNEPYINKKVFQCDQEGHLILSIKAEGVLLTGPERQELIDEINRLKRPTPQVRELIKKSHDNTVQIVKAVAATWGEAQSYRWTLDIPTWMHWAVPDRFLKNSQDDEGARTRAFNDLIEVFFGRSARRAAFGLPQGTFAISQFPLEKWQLNMITTTTETLLNIPDEDLFVDMPVLKVLSAGQDTANLEKEKDGFDALKVKLAAFYTEALNACESKQGDYARSASFTGPMKALVEGGDYGMIDSVNSMYEAARGKGSSWKVLYFALKLMALDFYEESALRTTGGMQKLRAMYRARYIDIPEEDRKFYQPLVKNFQDLYNKTTGRSSSVSNKDKAYRDVDFSMDVANSDGVVQIDDKTVSSQLVQQLYEWTANITQNRVIQIQLDLARRASGEDMSEEMGAIQTRILDL